MDKFQGCSQSRLAIFDTVSKKLTTYAVSSEANLIDLATDGQSVYGILNGLEQAAIVKLSLNLSGLNVVQQSSQAVIANLKF